MQTVAEILLFTLFFLLLSCKTKNGIKSETMPDRSRTNRIDTQLNTNINGLVRPAWYVQVPQKDGFLYSVGRASSLRITIAREKALMQAHVAMAKEIAKKRGISADSLNTILHHSYVSKEKQLKRGNRWYSYILLEMPVN